MKRTGQALVAGARLRRVVGELVEAFRFACDALTRHRLRSFLTTLGVTAGVAALVAVFGVIEGLTRSFESAVSELGARTLYVERTSWLAPQESRAPHRQPVTMREYHAIARNTAFAAAVAPLATAGALVQRPGLDPTEALLRGTVESYLETTGNDIREGRFLSEVDVLFARPVVILGADVADRLFPGLPLYAVVGERVLIAGRSFTIAGVLARAGHLLGRSLDRHVTIPITLFERMYGSKRSLVIAVASLPGRDDELADELTGILRRVRGVPPGADNDFTINRGGQLLSLYRGLTAGLYGLSIALGCLTLFVGGVGVMNVMLASVRERTREIGIQRAVGASRRAILLQFVAEALVFTSMGGLLGAVLGSLASSFIALISPLPAVPNPQAALGGVLFSACVGLVFGTWPAARAARLVIVEALRVE
jgi:putative ABC transport system permease protein